MPAHQRPTPDLLDQLVVYPPAHPHPSWVAYRSSSHAAAPVCLLSNDPRHWPRTPHTVLVVPAQRLSWHRTTLPPIAARQWQQALRGLLEEQLLEDPARLHLALAPDTRPATPTWVAACEKAWLEGVLKTLLEAGCRPERIVPELEPTLASDAACYLYGKPGQILLAQTGSEGVWAVCVPEPALLFLQQWPTGSDVTAVWAEPELLDLARSLRGGAVQSLTQGERLQRAARSRWNLAQFGLNPSPWLRRVKQAGAPWRAVWRSPQWRALRWSLVALALAQVIGLQSWFWQQRRLEQMARAEIDQLARQTLPGLSPQDDALARIRQHMRQLSLSSAAPARSDLVPMLGALAISGAPVPTEFRYAQGRIWLGPQDHAEDTYEEFKLKLGQLGYLLEPRSGQWQLSDLQP